MNQSLKEVMAWGLSASGVTALARQRQQGQLRMLMYHGVLASVRGPAAYGHLFLTVQAFERQMRHLRRAFHVIALGEAVDALASGHPLPERAVVITFDDGYRNTLTEALPVLRSLDLPAAVFLPAALTGAEELLWFDTLRILSADSTTYDAELHAIRRMPRPEQEAAMSRLLAVSRERRLSQRHPEFALANWDEWRQAVAAGGLEIGSHGLSHGNLVRLTADELREDLQRSKDRIERELGRPCRAIAYPYGIWDAGVAEAARQAGYDCGLTTDEGLNGPGGELMALRRTMVGDKGDFHLFSARVSGLWQALRPNGAM